MRGYFVCAGLLLLILSISGCSTSAGQSSSPTTTQTELVSQSAAPNADPVQSSVPITSNTATNVASASEGDAAIYLSAMRSACNKYADSSDVFEASVKRYVADQDIRYDKTWRVEIANTILDVYNAASRFEILPPAPNGLMHVDDLLHQLAKEIRSACLAFAKAIDTGSQTYMDEATAHQSQVQELALQAAGEVHDFEQKER